MLFVLAGSEGGEAILLRQEGTNLKLSWADLLYLLIINYLRGRV